MRKRCERVCGDGRGGNQVQLPPRQLRGLVESGHCRVCDDLRVLTDGRAHEEAGSMCQRLEPLRRQQRQAGGHPKAACGGRSRDPRADQEKRHKV